MFLGIYMIKLKLISTQKPTHNPGQCGSMVEHQAAHLRVLGSISGQGHITGLQVVPGPGLGVWHIREATNWCASLTSMFLSLPLPSSFPVALKKKKKSVEKISSGEDWQKIINENQDHAEILFPSAIVSTPWSSTREVAGSLGPWATPLSNWLLRLIAAAPSLCRDPPGPPLSLWLCVE